MSGLPWLRLYTEYATDPKIQILAFDDQRHFVMLLCLKGNGTLDCEAPSEAYRERLVAKALGLDAGTASEAKRRLIEGGLITADWMPVAWENRQFASDHNAAERQRRSRENRSRDSHSDVTTESCDSHAADKKRLDTDTDKKKTQKSPSAPLVEGLDLKAWEEWLTYRKAIGKPLKPASLHQAAKAMASLGDQQAAAVQLSVANGYQGLIAPKANQKPKEKPQWV